MLKSLTTVLADVFYTPAAARHRFQGPISGYYFVSSAAAIREIAGTAGAAQPRSPVASVLDSVRLAPNGRTAAALAGLEQGRGDLDFVPSYLERLSDSRYFHKSPKSLGEPGSPVWRVGGMQGTVYFVPAGEQF